METANVFGSHLQRTHTCADMGASLAGQRVRLNGWVHRLRDHGGVYFISLRDRYGTMQIVIDERSPREAREAAASLRPEYCIAVEGEVRLRPQEMQNKDMASGAVELAARTIAVLSTSQTPPFVIEDGRTPANEDLRLQYRYLDLRSGAMQHALSVRHKAAQAAREYLNGLNFFEIETPTLIRSTPEGARDFLVPSRIMPGSFYALAQSPQLYKQILMVGGMDRYYQLAHCYRDEDARGDRQPEHTQIDIEMSFVTARDVQDLAEGLMERVFARALDVALPRPFARMSYDEAMNLYGSDKPDLRYDLTLREVTQAVRGCGFGPFDEEGAAVVMLRVPKEIAAEMSRKHISELEEIAAQHGAKSLPWMRYAAEDGEAANVFSGGIAKFFEGEIGETFLATAATAAGKEKNNHAPQAGDLLLFAAHAQKKTAQTAMGAVRREIARRARLAEQALADKKFAFAWITDFPLFEKDEDTGGWSPAHHMFTMPQREYIDALEQDPGAVKGDLYDLVCNGMEIASGSIRIHDAALQQRIFRIIGMTDERAASRFGFLLEALKYGAPPHGGIAPGLDRLVMLMLGESTIRDCIAFPKNTNGASPMDGCPASVDESQLNELHLSLRKENK